MFFLLWDPNTPKKIVTTGKYWTIDLSYYYIFLCHSGKSTVEVADITYDLLVSDCNSNVQSFPTLPVQTIVRILFFDSSCQYNSASPALSGAPESGIGFFVHNHLGYWVGLTGRPQSVGLKGRIKESVWQCRSLTVEYVFIIFIFTLNASDFQYNFYQQKHSAVIPCWTPDGVRRSTGALCSTANLTSESEKLH